MSEPSPVIISNSLQKSFGDLEVLRGIDCQINKGEVVSIIGSSGCGKSTLLRCFNRLETITGGRLIVNGIDLSPSDLSRRRLLELRAQVGMVFQQFNLFPHLSVLENLCLAPKKVQSLSDKESKETASFYLDKVGLSEKANAYPDQLSGGQKQRVAIARALVNNPKILLADEPTAALDKKSGRDVVELMQKLAKEQHCTILLVTHDNRILDIADRIVYMEDGYLTQPAPEKKSLYA